MGEWLCKLGWHRWKRTNGKGIIVGNSQMAVFFDKTCTKCGKQETGSMLL